MKTIVILGGGITGLVAAYYLSKKFQVYVIEKQKSLGGMSTSFNHKNLILDYGPHKIYTQLPGIQEAIQDIVPLVKIKKRNSIYLLGNYFDFPLSLKQVALKMPSKAFSASLDMAKKSFGKLPDNSYENFLINRFGKTLYFLVFKNYADKIWGNPKLLDAELARRRVAVSSIFALIKSIIIKDTSKISAEYFHYPVKGSIQLIENLVKEIKKNKAKIITNGRITEIKLKNNKIEYIKVNNKKIFADYIVSTIYLDNLLEYMKTEQTIQEAGKKLEYVDLNILYFILNKHRVIDENWIFFPEKKFLFNRISEMKSFSPYLFDSDKTVLMAETIKPASKENIEKIKQQLISLNLFKDSEIEEIFTKTLVRAYPIYKKGYKNHLDKVLAYLDKIDNLYSIGRQGLFNYNNIDQCWDMAKKLSEHILLNKNKDDWKKLRKEFDNYIIVD